MILFRSSFVHVSKIHFTAACVSSGPQQDVTELPVGTPETAVNQTWADTPTQSEKWSKEKNELFFEPGFLIILNIYFHSHQQQRRITTTAPTVYVQSNVKWDGDRRTEDRKTKPRIWELLDWHRTSHPYKSRHNVTEHQLQPLCGRFEGGSGEQ